MSSFLHAPAYSEPRGSMRLHRVAIWQQMVTLVLLAMVLWTLTTLGHLETAEESTLVGLGLALAALSLISISLQQGGTLLGIGGVYLTYLVLSHLGMPAVLAIESRPPSIEDMPIWSIGWVDTHAASVGAFLSGLAAATIALVMSRPWRLPEPARPVLTTSSRAGLLRVGVIMLGMASLYLLVVTFLGILPINRGYIAYREAMEFLPGYSLVLVLLAMGMTFVAANADRRHLFWLLALIAIPCVILVMAGNRGEVLYPGIAALGVLAHRGIRIPRRTMIGLGLLLFIGIPVVRSTRTAEDSREAMQQLDWSPDAIFTEMGFTLRPLAETLMWQENGESYAMGLTYTIPIARTVLRAVPLVERPTLDGTLWDTADRLGGQGYSVVAEAVLNFGPWGVPFVFTLIGLGMLHIGKIQTDVGLTVAGGALAIGMNNIRNGFAFVPGQMIALVVLVATGIWWGKFLERQKFISPTQLS